MNIWFRRLLLVVSIGGGFAGLAITATQLYQPNRPFLYYLVCFFASSLYCFGIFGGLKLAEKEDAGAYLLFWYYLVQIPVISSPILSYFFASGLAIIGTLGNAGFSWAFSIGSRWQVLLLQISDGTFALGVNGFALWAAWFLRGCKVSRTSQPEKPTGQP